ncbi:MAG: hypothetical protein KKC77_01880 [Proteobacteria bacterium]|nr:hypothetical protein [Pseudomonadota bacterium]
MQKKNIAVILAGGWLLLFLFGCGPVYKTEYTYRPPQSPQGQTCIMQCEKIKRHCYTNEEFRVRACEDENMIARLEYDRCISMNYERCWDRSAYCNSANYEYCDEEYRICYQNCGGLVSGREICVSGCDK